MTLITEDDIPEEFICPITNEIMRNPLMSVHGFSFEREAIFEWLQSHSTCPLSRRELTVSKLVSNCALQERIRGWCEANGMLHLLRNNNSTAEDDPCDPRHRLVLGICITKQLEEKLRLRQRLQENHVRRQQRRVSRAMALVLRHRREHEGSGRSHQHNSRGVEVGN
uniref:U-box domain-containing protein n=1 Tax=Amphora coffeiformis TaxID=265554 RepID=A0A7S3KXJ4_9STRA